MPAANWARLIDDVRQHLLACADAKRLMGGGELALQSARRAYELTEEDPAGLRPWRQIAAYRWAHLLMRRPTAGNLERAASLLETAAGADEEPSLLEPLASIYRLAALHGLRRRSGGAMAGPDLERDIQATWARAAARLPPLAGALDRADWPTERQAIESNGYNLLELATYFLGADRSPLDGLAPLPFLEPGHDQRWLVVGSGMSATEAYVTSGLALRQRDAIGTREPGAVLFEVDDDGGSIRWPGSGEFTLLRGRGRQAHILAHLLARGPLTSKRLQALTHPVNPRDPDDTEDAASTRFRTELKELRKRLAAAFDIDKPTEAIALGPDDKLWVSDRVRAFGAVRASALERR